LYRAFEAICRDEDAFRTQLTLYALPPDGSRPITPKQVPPIVFNSHPQLQPAPANKMFNADLVAASYGGQWIERTGLAEDDLEHNAELFGELIRRHTPQKATLVARVDGGADAAVDLWWFVASHDEVVDVLRRMLWTTEDVLKLELRYLRGDIGDPEVDDWAVLLPSIGKPKSKWRLNGREFSCVERTRVDSPTGGRFLAFSDPEHRLVAEALAGVQKHAERNEPARQLHARRRGALLLYPTKEKGRPKQPKTPFMGIAVLPPPSSVRRAMQFSVRQPANSDAVVVNVSRGSAMSRQSRRRSRSRSR
jgi:hypothetical protein